MLRIIQRRAIWYSFSGVLLALSIASLVTWGVRYGIDFTGGSLLEVAYSGSRPKLEDVTGKLTLLDLGNVVVQPAGEQAFILRFRHVDEETHQRITSALRESGGEMTERRFESVGPTIGAELKSRSLWAIAIALFFIVSYVAWAFRKVSRPVASWKYGVAAVIALAHDVVITVGVFSALGHYFGVEVDALFVSAILTIIGFSVHDTIVVFDRTRENLFRGAATSFEDTVNKSVNDTITRSINTSLTTLLVLTALFLFGGESIHYFALALIVGITMGTYSSIFNASPLVVDWHKLTTRPAKR